MKITHGKCLRPLIRSWTGNSGVVQYLQREGGAAKAAINWLVFTNLIFPWNFIALQMSNISSEMLSKASLFSAAVPHSHESSTSQSSRHTVCVSLVWFPLHQGGGPKGNTIWPGQGSAWKEKYSKSCSCSLPQARNLSSVALYISSDLFLSFTQEIVRVSNSAPQWAEGHTALVFLDSLWWLMESPAWVSN